jgi:hypothetical protein
VAQGARTSAPFSFSLLAPWGLHLLAPIISLEPDSLTPVDSMTRFASFAFLVLLASCGTSQAQKDQPTTFAGTRFDVDINGSVVLVDAEKNTVRLLSSELKTEAEIGGSGWGDDQFDRPAGVWARNGIDIFIADYGNHRIQRFDRKLAFISSFSTRERPNPEERFGYPTDVAVSRLGDLFICDGENARILKVSGLSRVERAFGGFDAGKGRLRKPTNIEIGPNDNVVVHDAGLDAKQGDRVVVFDNFGNFIHILGDGLFTGALLLFADDNGTTVVSDNKMFFFDRNDRMVLTEELRLLEVSKVASFVIDRTGLCFLTADGFQRLPDPRKQ